MHRTFMTVSDFKARNIEYLNCSPYLVQVYCWEPKGMHCHIWFNINKQTVIKLQAEQRPLQWLQSQMEL